MSLNNKIQFVFICLLLIVSRQFAYQWPLESSDNYHVSASVGERRLQGYHTGVDIAGKESDECIAILNGNIYDSHS